MSPRGEKRAGGRPPIAENKKRQNLVCRVAPETKLWLEGQKAETDRSIGELVDRAIEVLQKHPEESFPAVET